MRHTLLPLHRLRRLSQTHLPSPIRNILDILKANLGPELLTLPRLGANPKQLINFLKRQALRLVDHEPDKGDADEAERSPQEEDLGLEVGVFRVDHVGRGVGDGPVEELERDVSFVLM